MQQDSRRNSRIDSEAPTQIGSKQRNRRVIVFWALLLAFFWLFHASVLKSDFGRDELRNLYSYWNPSLGKVLVSEIAFWNKFVRPMGAIYYLPLYTLFGLNPVPFAVLRTLILLANAVLFYKLAALIGRSWWIAMLATFPIAYHSNLGNLAYDGAFIYDVLCGGFYFAALLYYLHCRRSQESLRPLQLCAFLALYICALDSKEMAVSLPVIVLAYELLFERRKAKPGIGLAAAAVTLVFIAGKAFGAGTLTEMEAYRPVFTWARYAEASTRFVNTVFYTTSFTMGRVLALEAALLYIGLRNWGNRKWDPRWLFLLIWVVVTPLPIAFLPDRGGGTLYIVAGGWAMLVAMSMRAVMRRIAREPVAGLSRSAIMAAGLLACIVAYAHETRRTDQSNLNWYLSIGDETRRAIHQFEVLGVRPPARSRVAFLDDPFPDTYHTLFLASLFWKDPSIEINLQRRYRLGDDELAKMDYIFDEVNGRLVVVKPATANK